MHFLLISENEFTHEITCNGMTSFMEFMRLGVRSTACDKVNPRHSIKMNLDLNLDL